jgi:hypothetical protein
VQQQGGHGFGATDFDAQKVVGLTLQTFGQIGSKGRVLPQVPFRFEVLLLAGEVG